MTANTLPPTAAGSFRERFGRFVTTPALARFGEPAFYSVNGGPLIRLVVIPNEPYRLSTPLDAGMANEAPFVWVGLTPGMPLPVRGAILNVAGWPPREILAVEPNPAFNRARLTLSETP